MNKLFLAIALAHVIKPGTCMLAVSLSRPLHNDFCPVLQDIMTFF